MDAAPTSGRHAQREGAVDAVGPLPLGAAVGRVCEDYGDNGDAWTCWRMAAIRTSPANHDDLRAAATFAPSMHEANSVCA
jgi:hypothetical protein